MSLEPINSALFLDRQTSPKVWVITSNHDIVTEISLNEGNLSNNL